MNVIKNPLSSSVCFVAELGINHDGDLKIIKKMIDQALEAKADAIKFQLYNIDRFYNRLLSPESYNLFQSFYISYEDFLHLKNYAESRGIIAFAAPFDTETLYTLVQDSIFPIKIASGDALTEPWLDYLLQKDVPFIVSTGSLEQLEIQQLAKKLLGSLSAMLYCVSEYPAPAEGFDLTYLKVIQSYLPNQAIGFSDHSQGIALSLAAIAYRAKIIERHFTLFPERTDLDHPLSLSPEEFYQMVTDGRMIEKALGTGVRVTTPTEQKIRTLAGRDAYASKDIPANTPLTEDFIILQRPGQGISSIEFQSLLGKVSHQSIAQGTLLRSVFL
ncbi:MAG: N-acetylneuraminate synthase family protein [Brevinema sp.]